MQGMSAVGDLDLIRKRQVAFSNRGISLRCRSTAVGAQLVQRADANTEMDSC